MSVTVRIPTALRKLADGQETLEVGSGDLRTVIGAIASAHPKLGEQLLDEKGQIRRFVNLFANDEDVRFLDELDTRLNDGDELSIVPAIAGGRRCAA